MAHIMRQTKMKAPSINYCTTGIGAALKDPRDESVANFSNFSRMQDHRKR